MSKMDKKRTNNFTSDEKIILSELVLKYRNVVENKRTDATSNADKLRGWEKLAAEFNTLSTYCYRSHLHLKCCWENIKRQTKKDKAETKKKMFMTGGGKPPTPPPSQHQKIIDAVDTVLGPGLDGISNNYDGDTAINDTIIDFTMGIKEQPEYNVYVIHEDHPFENTTKENKENTKMENEVVCLPSTSNATLCLPSTSNATLKENNANDKWSSWTPNNLKTPVSEVLKPGSHNESRLKRRRPKSDCSGDVLIKEKIELVRILKENAIKEGNIRIAILEEQLKQEKLKTQKNISDLFHASI